MTLLTIASETTTECVVNSLKNCCSEIDIIEFVKELDCKICSDYFRKECYKYFSGKLKDKLIIKLTKEVIE